MKVSKNIVSKMNVSNWLKKNQIHKYIKIYIGLLLYTLKKISTIYIYAKTEIIESYFA